MLTITKAGKPVDGTQGEQIVTEEDGSKTHYLGEVRMSLTLPQEQPATTGE